MTRALRRLVVALGLLAFGLAMALGVTYPVLPAALCPGCFGLERLAGGVLADEQGTAVWRRDLLAEIDAAQAHVDGELARPDARRWIIACATADCARRLRVRGAYGLTLSTPIGAVVYLAPGGATATIIRHELAHVAIHAHAGVAASLNGALPAWLDEGLAVVVSEDPAHLRAGQGADRCAAPPVGLVSNPFEFARAAARDPALYTRAACAALHLEAQLGGRAALIEVLGQLRHAVALPELQLP